MIKTTIEYATILNTSLKLLDDAVEFLADELRCSGEDESSSDWLRLNKFKANVQHAKWIASGDFCEDCENRGWLLMDVDSSGAGRIEKCDQCDHFTGDHIAEQAALDHFADLLKIEHFAGTESVSVHPLVTKDCPHYDNDDVMADFGRQIIDQYLGWVQKYGNVGAYSGWASFMKNSVENMLGGEEP